MRSQLFAWTFPEPCHISLNLRPTHFPQVDMGEGLKVPMFLGKPPANYTSEHQDAWHKFRREMEGKVVSKNPFILQQI
jgi:hypothetical protein